MLLDIFLVIVGFLILAWGADRLVTGSSAFAKNNGISPLIIGLTIVALGTSAPEIFVAITSALRGSPDIGIGNAIGSNIANIGLVLGIAALVKPLTVSSGILRREYPMLFIIMILAWLLLFDGHVGRLDGTILLLGLIAVMLLMVHLARTSKAEPLADEFAQELPQQMSNPRAIMWFLIGLVTLPLGAHVIVLGAVNLAEHFGISELVIGLTIVAIGTSLPEVAASITAAFKGEDDIAIGNILGSNIFNLLAVLPFPGLIHPGPINSDIITRDMPIMFGITILFFVVSYTTYGPTRISRWEGGMLLVYYVTYLTLLIYAR